ncbi:galactokinase [Blastococcus sp. SYSU DS1021]
MTGVAARETFARTVGGEPDLVVRSPGRVNLIGEHTDYNDGFVLPAALDRGTVVAARRRSDGRLRTTAVRMGGNDDRAVADLRPQEGAGWSRYVAGAAAVLQDEGHQLTGADLVIDSDLPIGAGLSSSASLELGVMVALLALTGDALPPETLARLGQRVENEVIGVRTGIMDQLAIAGGVAGHAVLVDCRSLATEAVPVPSGTAILVLDSAVPRTLAGSAYNDRRAECESAVAALSTVDPGLRALRDVSPDLLAEHARLLDGVQLRRARHVVGENARVLAAADALRRGDARAFGELMDRSHASLRDDYEVSVPELDALVGVARGTAGVLGARLTGAGFGGCAVALVERDSAAAAAAAITAAYRSATGRPGEATICTPSDGTGVV